MKIFDLSETQYWGLTGEEKKKVDTTSTFFSNYDKEISVDLYYLHAHKDPAKTVAQENYILEEIALHRPDIVVYHPAWRKMSDHFFKTVHLLNVPLVSIFADTLSSSTPEELRIIQNSDYIIIFDSVTNYFRYKFLYEATRSKTRGGVIFAGGHQLHDEIGKGLPVIPKEYDVSLIGSIEGFRKNMAEFFTVELRKRNLVFYCGGGIINNNANQSADVLSEAFLPHDKYLEAINKSKINIVSQTRAERCQVKCKVFEYMGCGAFCLVDKNIEYDFIIPDDVVVYYTSLDDCLEKIIYYAAHDEEREAIAARGKKWFKDHFNHEKFWNACLYAIKERREELPCIPQLIEIEKKLKNNFDFTNAMLVEVKRLIVALNSGKNDAAQPIYTVASSSTRNSVFTKDPLGAQYWRSDHGWPQSLTFDFGVPIPLNTMKVHHVLENNVTFVKFFAVQASNSLGFWKTLLLGDMDKLQQLQTYSFNNKTAYRFYRLVGYSNHIGSQEMILSNVEFFNLENAPGVTPLSSLTLKWYQLRILYYRIISLPVMGLRKIYRKLPHRYRQKIRGGVSYMARGVYNKLPQKWKRYIKMALGRC